jgi:hypothetical protein
MQPADLLERSIAPAVLGAMLTLAPLAAAQTAPIQAANPTTAPAQPATLTPAVYVPTSLVAEPGLLRTRDGRPDFNGDVWQADYFGMLEAVPMMLPAQLVLAEDKAKEAFDKMMAMFTGNPAVRKALEADPEAMALLSNTAGFPVVRGQRHTRLVVVPADGKIPFTAAARAEASGAMTRAAAMKLDNPEDRTASERCLALGGQAPLAMMNPLSPRQFVQTRDYIIIQTEYGGEARIIPFAAAHRPVALHPVMGDSIARWDGETLVIETTGFLAKDRERGSFPTALLVNPDSKVIERYTRVSKDELLYQFTIEDPKLYTAPWLAEYSLFRQSYRLYESACHEGNYSLPNMLSGQRVADIRRVEAFKPSDADGDGKLSKAEYAVLLKTLGFASQLETLFPQRDVNKDGFVSAAEYGIALP